MWPAIQVEAHSNHFCSNWLESNHSGADATQALVQDTQMQSRSRWLNLSCRHASRDMQDNFTTDSSMASVMLHLHFCIETSSNKE